MNSSTNLFSYLCVYTYLFIACLFWGFFPANSEQLGFHLLCVKTKIDWLMSCYSTSPHSPIGSVPWVCHMAAFQTFVLNALVKDEGQQDRGAGRLRPSARSICPRQTSVGCRLSSIVWFLWITTNQSGSASIPSVPRLSSDGSYGCHMIHWVCNQTPAGNQ